MRMLQLAFRGFGPYRDAQTIDFAGLADDGLFLITGKTGAGKSTVLDAIAFALYGSVPRYDGSVGRVRSTFASLDDPTDVTLEFEHGGERYRIARSPEYERRKKRAGEGTTTQAATQQLDRWDAVADDWIGVATKAGVVAEELARIFPLTGDEFFQVVLLAQGDFQRFLHADSQGRQELLRKLFRTQHYRDLRELAQERSRAAAQELHDLQQSLRAIARELELGDDDAAVTEESLTSLATEVAAEVMRSEAELESARTASDAAAKRLRELERQLERQQRRAAATAQLERLEAERDAIVREVDEPLRRDRLASPLMPVLEAHARAERARADGVRAHEAAAAALDARLARDDAAELREPVASGADLPTCTAVLEQLREHLGTLRAGESIDQRVDEAQHEVTDTERALEATRTQLAELRAARGGRPEQLRAFERTVAELEAKAEQLEAANTRVSALAAQLAAAQDAAKLRERAEQALAERERAAEALTRASERDRELIARRLEGSAAELASRLTPGEPCAVCGSTTHPAPAEPAGAPVTDADLDASSLAVQAAKDVDTAAREAYDAISTTLAKRTGDASGLTPDEAAARHREARDHAEQLQRATEKLATTREAAAKLEARDADDAVREVELTARVDTQLAASAAAVSELRSLTSQQRALRGEFDNVRTRREMTESVADALAATIATQRAADAAADAARDAATRAAERLVASEFADEAQARAAALSDQARGELTERRRAHDSGLDGARKTLAEPELQHLPDAPVEIEPAREAARLAADALGEAQRAHGAATSRRASIDAAIARGRKLLQGASSTLARARLRQQLAGELRGDNARKLNLEAYVLAAHLEEIVQAANVRLGEITANRYSLVRDDSLARRGAQSGLGLEVADIYTGISRTPQSLSGGETFLVSLALALGLADVVSAQAGGISLDTLFIDEGFGSLDAETLETAMRTLDHLRASGRTVGVISHVTSMHERIPTHIEVRQLDDGSSRLETRDAG
ncbi:AAA family ATPase [Gulosibacter faecalis]|uniref:Nuclease SbcCD subunit C n=1 Tax=Gulosibacter faecalis TaxID=272240 RepID=A0ABW5UZV5_9MICO|nr:SMC family ATPase [Gulosibacter faecalis]